MIASAQSRHYYSVFTLVAQYLFPFTTISTLYGLIFRYLKKHRLIQADAASQVERARRTNVMLAAISFGFCLCWLPLNLFCVIADSTHLLAVIKSLIKTNQTGPLDCSPSCGKDYCKTLRRVRVRPLPSIWLPNRAEASQ